ncbi:type II toxin-antitoxin system death-on-curing family toxin [Candidatus Falkowbacteria bacterium]|nr:type II toxin-antitoxin system death-on-curing family toxin [Candidatus Falkowbacteria bacterium]
MSKIIYPTEEDLHFWIKLVNEASDQTLKPYLPPYINKNWYKNIISLFDLLKMDYYGNNVYQKSAHLFYKVCKNHYYVDGNKRSAIICVYLFSLLNDKFTGRPNDLYQLAKQVSKSKPESREIMVDKLKSYFKNEKL